MRFKIRLRAECLFGFLIVLSLTTGCNKQAPVTNPSSASSIPGKSSASNSGPLDISNLEVVIENETKERKDFQENIRALVRREAFELLESQAEGFRTNKLRFPNGSWKLRMFYAALSDLPDATSDAGWLQWIGQLQKWARQFPNSAIPRVGLAGAYHGYAMFARGEDSADKVTEQGGRLMEERIGKGFACLVEAKKLLKNKVDCGFCGVFLRECLGANVDRKLYESFFDAAVRSEPAYDAVYDYKAYYLTSRWYGRPGEWEEFARKASQGADAPESKEIFARCVMYLRGLGVFYDEYSNDETSWEELKSSFRALENNYPDSLEIKSSFCAIATQLYDYKEGREQMRSLKGKVDPSVWHTKEDFIGVADWLNNDDATLEQQRREFRAKQARTK